MTHVLPQLESYVFNGQQPGPHLLVVGGVHGNEPVGSLVIDRIRREIASGELTIDRGRLVLLPRLNTVAIAANQRFVLENLNRGFVPLESEPASEEAAIRQVALEFVTKFCLVEPHELRDEHYPSRFLIDLHSFHTPGQPHAWIYTAPDSEFTASRDFQFVSELGVPRILRGWREAYRAINDKHELAAAGLIDRVRSLDSYEQGLIQGKLGDLATTLGQYAYYQGAISTTVECGQHDDPEAPDVGYSAVRKALQISGIASSPVTRQKIEAGHLSLVTVDRVVFRVAGDRLVRHFNDLETLQPNEPVVTGGRAILVPSQTDRCLILYPNKAAPDGSELFYFAREEPFTPCRADQGGSIRPLIA